MLPILSMIFIPVATFIYMYKIHQETIADVIPESNNSNQVINLIPKVKDASEVKSISEQAIPVKALKNETSVSKVKMLNWKLKKNLETLVFLTELESRYDKTNVTSSIVKEYYDLKAEVQKNTIDISNQLAIYKSLESKCA